jgi:hypothetical protein
MGYYFYPSHNVSHPKHIYVLPKSHSLLKNRGNCNFRPRVYQLDSGHQGPITPKSKDYHFRDNSVYLSPQLYDIHV